MIKAQFDIQRVHVDGSSLYYEVFYLQGKSYSKVSDTQFTSMAAAREFITNLIRD